MKLFLDINLEKYRNILSDRDERILEEMKEFACIEFDINDIVRSGLVKSYLLSKYNLGF